MIVPTALDATRGTTVDQFFVPGVLKGMRRRYDPKFLLSPIKVLLNLKEVQPVPHPSRRPGRALGCIRRRPYLRHRHLRSARGLAQDVRRTNQ